jgi:L-ascorbate metabolism protein UlaG (beta-lactamase superfamily)
MSVTVTWWGHATATVEVGGVRVLTDPLFSDRLAHLRRQVSPVPVATAAEADVVIVSHFHADHLHVPSLRRVRPDARIIAPAGSVPLLQRLAPALLPRVDEVRESDEVKIADLVVRAVAAHHDGRRHNWSRDRGPALGYVLTSSDQTVWFAGDTGLFDGMAELGPVDTALVPVGGWGPTLGPEHLDPRQASEAIARVGARHAVPIHYGTYWPIGLRAAAPDVFRRRCRQPGADFAAAMRGSNAMAQVVEPGASVTLP